MAGKGGLRLLLAQRAEGSRHAEGVLALWLRDHDLRYLNQVLQGCERSGSKSLEVASPQCL